MRTTVLVIGLLLMLMVPFSVFSSVNKTNDPSNLLKSSDPHITRQQIDFFKSAKGLDKPVFIRYFYWLKDAVKGNFWISKDSGETASILMILLASLLSGIAALFSIKKPFVSMVIFVIAALTSIIASAYGFSLILLVLALFSYFGYKELKKKAPVIQY